MIDWFLYVRGLHLKRVWNTQPQRNLQFLQNAILAANLTKSSRGNEPSLYSKNCIKHNTFGYSSEIPQYRKYSIYWKTSVLFYFFNFLRRGYTMKSFFQNVSRNINFIVYHTLKCELSCFFYLWNVLSARNI